ncbi:MAG: hypothetical protein KC978_08675 [Candidatus Omnitrophica bacterium]|nr:hypothetical protein [Candidatus Omnitrophota bacterium]
MNKDQVVAQIEDWEKRLVELYNRIESWYNELPPNETKEFLSGSVLQRDEGPMRRVDVPPRMLPTRSVLYGKNRVSFVPSALWIVGANGRVNATTNRRQFSLIDVRENDEAPSDWQIVTSQLAQTHVPFTQEVFNDLIERQLIEAA